MRILSAAILCSMCAALGVWFAAKGWAIASFGWGIAAGAHLMALADAALRRQD